ncbi:hypothetical protein LL946_01290 [Knoellia locipacati]|uniref:hypothetical protein n=1 Tax=Knoellia locipacati TaxID=882824 RepID=UPI00384A68FF
MNLHTTSRRAAAAAATTAVAGILTIVPAHARQDPGPSVGAKDARPDGSSLQYSAPAPASPSLPAPAMLVIDDGAVEYLQIGLGAVAGMAVVGAVVASTRRHAHAQPA